MAFWGHWNLGMVSLNPLLVILHTPTKPWFSRGLPHNGSTMEWGCLISRGWDWGTAKLQASGKLKTKCAKNAKKDFPG